MKGGLILAMVRAIELPTLRISTIMPYRQRVNSYMEMTEKACSVAEMSLSHFWNSTPS